MKRLVFGIAALAALTVACRAGTETYAGPAAKEYKQVETPACFSDQEWQVDLFGAYEVGNGPDHAGPIDNHAWGGGAAVNYFFMKYFGVSVEGDWLAGHESVLDHDAPEIRNQVGSDLARYGLSPGLRAAYSNLTHSTTFNTASGSLIFRYPIEKWCIAPYVFTGGGATMSSATLAEYHVGTGLEYRVVPNKVGVFVDGRWNYYGDRYGHDVQNNFLLRTGVRLVF
jgi:hypothetical protein